MSIIESATKTMLLTKIRETEWQTKPSEESARFNRDYCIAGDAFFVAFHASGCKEYSGVWVTASFFDTAISTEDESRYFLEQTFDGQHEEEEVLFKAREWLIANADKAVDIWAKRYN